MSRDLNICYCCGIELDKTTKTREHIPPKCFFPKGYKDELITVPSCKEHNNAKSEDDEYLWQMIAINILANKHGQNLATEKVVKSILRNRRLTKNLAKNSHLLYIENSNGSLEPTFGFEPNEEMIKRSISMLAKGVYFHEYKKVFDGNMFVFDENTIYIKGNNFQAHNKYLEKLRNCSKHIFNDQRKIGENQEIFYYQFIELNKSEKYFEILLRLCFYENVVFLVSLKSGSKPNMDCNILSNSLLNIIYK